jgi:transcriptional regulator with XRE-family HTH domain
MMATINFSKRFRELVRGLSDTELGYILGVSADAARKVRNGDIKSLKLQAALRLARQLDVSPWYLAGEPEPAGAAVENPAGSRDRSRRGKVTTNGGHLRRFSAGAPLSHDDVMELRTLVQRLEAAVRDLQARERL